MFGRFRARLAVAGAISLLGAAACGASVDSQGAASQGAGGSASGSTTGAGASQASSTSAGASGPVQGEGGGHVVTTHPNAKPIEGEAACTVVERTGIPEPNFNHIDPCTPITYATPPSGGNHWPIWAEFKTFTKPAPREMFVHDLEHGAIVFTYKCTTDCDAIVKAFEDARDEIRDPLCLTQVGPTSRTVITPDPLLGTPIGLSAWGNTYTATCIDPPSIRAFVSKFYGHGREDLCNQGFTPPTCN